MLKQIIKEAILHYRDLLRRRCATLKKGARFAGDDDPYYPLILTWNFAQKGNIEDLSESSHLFCPIVKCPALTIIKEAIPPPQGPSSTSLCDIEEGGPLCGG
jgi:hypothetical protein